MAGMGQWTDPLTLTLSPKGERESSSARLSPEAERVGRGR